jgi:hypothetical protein
MILLIRCELKVKYTASLFDIVARRYMQMADIKTKADLIMKFLADLMGKTATRRDVINGTAINSRRSSI